jgi:hypothetical protein
MEGHGCSPIPPSFLVPQPALQPCQQRPACSCCVSHAPPASHCPAHQQHDPHAEPARNSLPPPPPNLSWRSRVSSPLPLPASPPAAPPHPPPPHTHPHCHPCHTPTTPPVLAQPGEQLGQLPPNGCVARDQRPAPWGAAAQLLGGGHTKQVLWQGVCAGGGGGGGCSEDRTAGAEGRRRSRQAPRNGVHA